LLQEVGEISRKETVLRQPLEVAIQAAMEKESSLVILISMMWV